MYKEYLLIVNTDEKGREVFWLSTEQEVRKLMLKYEPWEIEANYKIKLEAEYNGERDKFLQL